MRTLEDTQRKFFESLLFPLRGASRRRAELPLSNEAHDPAFLSTANELLRPSPTLVPAECLELYHRQVWFRLLDSVAEDFPGLKTLLGNEAFGELVEKYLLAHPSHSFTLRHLGRAMPQFVRETINEPLLRRRAAAVASIEWAMMESFEAADLPLATPDRFAEGTFSLQEHLNLLEIGSDASSWLDNPEFGWLDEGPFHVAVWRTQDGRIRHRTLVSNEFFMLKLLSKRDLTLNQWLAESESHIPDAATLQGWCIMWQTDGWFANNPSVSSLT